MALPIAPTPILTGKSAERFDRMMEEVDRTPPQKLEWHHVDWDAVNLILRERSKKERGAVK